LEREFGVAFDGANVLMWRRPAARGPNHFFFLFLSSASIWGHRRFLFFFHGVHFHVLHFCNFFSPPDDTKIYSLRKSNLLFFYLFIILVLHFFYFVNLCKCFPFFCVRLFIIFSDDTKIYSLRNGNLLFFSLFIQYFSL